MSWRYLGASVSGTSHIKTATPCQDAHVIRCMESKNGEVMWAILADGAGSARFGKLGAEIVCNSYANRIERWLIGREGDIEGLDGITIKKWVERIRKELDELAKGNEASLRDYACTLLGILVGKHCGICFQIGDGGIIVSNSSEEYRIVFWPENGEYANTTHFLTDETATETLHVAILTYAPQAIALFSDGIQRLTLHFASRTVHMPFFVPMFQRLATEPPGYALELEAGLQAFLNSPMVNERTDDDKSLILATYCESIIPDVR